MLAEQDEDQTIAVLYFSVLERNGPAKEALSLRGAAPTNVCRSGGLSCQVLSSSRLLDVKAAQKLLYLLLSIDSELTAELHTGPHIFLIDRNLVVAHGSYEDWWRNCCLSSEVKQCLFFICVFVQRILCERELSAQLRIPSVHSIGSDKLTQTHPGAKTFHEAPDLYTRAMPELELDSVLANLERYSRNIPNAIPSKTLAINEIRYSRCLLWIVDRSQRFRNGWFLDHADKAAQPFHLQLLGVAQPSTLSFAHDS
eukprot:765494-Hanusia_phi.AAC.2